MIKTRILCLHIKGEIDRHKYAFHIYKEILQKNYYTEKQHEFMDLTNLELDKNIAILTLTTKEARDMVLKERFTFNNEKLQVSTPTIGAPTFYRTSGIISSPTTSHNANIKYSSFELLNKYSMRTIS